jgi:hypothetical protein
MPDLTYDEQLRATDGRIRALRIEMVGYDEPGTLAISTLAGLENGRFSDHPATN